MHRLIATLGLPGAGKSTQAKALARTLGGTAFSVGDWLRRLAADGDESARATVASGDTISPEKYRRFLHHVFDDAPASLLMLDGSPRDARHVAVLAEVLAIRSPRSHVFGVLLELPTLGAAESRIRGRSGAGPSQRHDDSQEIATRRIALQSCALAHLSARFLTLWPLVNIDATGCEEAVTEQVLGALPSSWSSPSTVVSGQTGPHAR